MELLVNGQSLGTKDVKKDSHVAWNVKYAPGNIEARGFKDGKQVMTTKRETTAPAAKLILTVDRQQISADGEDVAMFAVAVQDAQGRVVPVTDNDVTFNVSGAGKLIGTGNGDPTNQQPDKGTSRKAFSGYCMALIQSTKSAGSITVEATSPGLTSSSVTITSKQVTLRPQIAVWQREVPQGSGITGLWRPLPAEGEASELLAFFAGGGTMIFTLQQSGNALTGTVEGTGGGFFGGSDVPTPITDGTINGDTVSFKAGNSTYSGKVNGDRIDLEREIKLPWHLPAPAPESPDRPAIGPAPDGSDPSLGNWHIPKSIPIVLHRVQG